MRIGTPFGLGVDSSAVRQFYADNWNRPIPLTQERFYNWQFKSAPGSDSQDLCCIAVEENGAVIGVMGLNERPFFLQGQRRAAAELTTWIVNREVQNKGVGPSMLAYLQDKYDVLLGLGITPAAAAIYLRSGFRLFNPIPRYMRVFNWENVEPYAKFDERTKKVERAWIKNRETINYCKVPFDPDLLAGITASFSGRYNMFDRSLEWLQWRYNEHPAFGYEIQIVRSEGAVEGGAVVVYRVVQPTEDLRIAHVVDLMGDAASMESALVYLEDVFSDQDVDFADFYSTCGIHQGLMLERGWFSLMGGDLFQFPHLFNPIEFRTPPSTSMVIWAKHSPREIFVNSSCYISKQDCDFDRP
jgi:hypothetical protein